MNEEQWLAKARTGDKKAFEALYKRYYANVHRFCMTFGGIDAETAKDVLQESFVRAFRHLNQLREGQKFNAWLLAIARNRCLSFLRREGAFTKKHQALTRQFDVFNGVSKSELAEVERHIALVHEVIDSFPEGVMKQSATAFYVEGLNTTQIAEQFGIPKSTVTTRLDRFRIRIRRQLLKKLMEE